ncbi:MAG: sigma-70 family RNA polymerase sigma factor [Candidatus Omnitrophica bacterium]|nr:sigma-70 family RNA polymerase sigma factor [Candidatus Omnitrophota bacterium]
MTSPNYRGFFEDWEIGVAKNVIAKLRKEKRCLELEDFDDLLQECLIHWYFVKEKYDPSSKASAKTFMARVVKNKLSNIAKEYRRDKRKVFQKSISIDQPLSEDNELTLSDTLSTENPPHSNLRSQLELRIELEKTMQKLSPQQKEICKHLEDETLSIKDISQSLNIDRGTVYREIKRIRAIFEEDKLKDFLR